ncbi:MAG: hypothetical protein RLP15_11285 [Cryomorphaceae bacterium]
MKVLQEVFGKVESPAITAAEILHKSEQERSDLKLKDDHGAVISLQDIEIRMNEVARSLISLGLICGNRIAIYGLSYSDALLVYLAAEQIGVNVVHLGENGPLTDQLRNLQPRLTICAEQTETLQMGPFGEFLIIKANELNGSESILTWTTFLDLKRFASEWELERFRIIPA